MNPFGKKHSRLQAMRALKDEGMQNHQPRTDAAGYREAFSQCPKCKRVIPARAMQENHMVCPSCGHYLTLTADARMQETFDGAYTRIDDDLVGCDPLDFPGYREKLEGLRERTKLSEAAVCAVGSVGGVQTVVVVMDSRFMMGSMGTAVGERVTRAVEYATDKRLPLIIFCASGGARMQEGIMSLMQMAKTSAAIARHDAAGLLYISVMTHPTTGGVTASFANLGDVLLAEPHALIGFAGPRVIEQTINQKLPAGFQRAESLLKCGFLDAVVERSAMRETLIRILNFAQKDAPASGAAGNPQAEAIEAAHDNAGTLVPQALSDLEPKERLVLARHPKRPHINAYLDRLFTDFVELHGDRCFGDDGSIVGGIARYHGAPVMVIGQRKGDDVRSNIACNFGMPEPEGYRKVQRLARLAGKFGRPVITFIDTPGAYPGIEAEERGQGEAIAQCLALFSQLPVPVVAVVAGEGGSGGALALGVADRVIMLENSVYAVLSPEGFATILWKDRSRADEACDVMKITAPDLLSLNVVDEIVPEGEGGAHKNREAVLARTDEAIARNLDALRKLSASELVDGRYKRFRSFGTYTTGEMQS